MNECQRMRTSREFKITVRGQEHVVWFYRQFDGDLVLVAATDKTVHETSLLCWSLGQFWCEVADELVPLTGGYLGSDKGMYDGLPCGAHAAIEVRAAARRTQDGHFRPGMDCMILGKKSMFDPVTGLIHANGHPLQWQGGRKWWLYSPETEDDARRIAWSWIHVAICTKGILIPPALERAIRDPAVWSAGDSTSKTDAPGDTGSGVRAGTPDQESSTRSTHAETQASAAAASARITELEHDLFTAELELRHANTEISKLRDLLFDDSDDESGVVDPVMYQLKGDMTLNHLVSAIRRAGHDPGTDPVTLAAALLDLASSSLRWGEWK